MSKGRAILKTLAGLAIGAIAGILFAPKKGSKTRKQIMDKGVVYGNELKSRFDELSDTLTEKIESTRKAAEGMLDKGKAKYNGVEKEVKNAAADLEHESAEDHQHATS